MKDISYQESIPYVPSPKTIKVGEVAFRTTNYNYTGYYPIVNIRGIYQPVYDTKK
jgi:hypothetical protein